MGMGVATWTLIAIVLGAIVTFSVELRTSIRALRCDLDTKIQRLDTKLDSVRVDLETKMERLDTKLGTVRVDLETKMERLDTKLGTVRVDLDTKLDRRFDILSADVAAIRAAQHRTDGQLQVLVAMAHSHLGSQAVVDPAPAA
jgi:Skp family chaperone for outer membrane proteins